MIIEKIRSSQMVILCFLFITALALRLYNITQPLLEYSGVRQYHGALVARDFYYRHHNNPDYKTKKESAHLHNILETKEPRIMELLTSFIYRFTGEHLWIPRILSIICWLIGGIFLLLIQKKMAGLPSVWLCIAFYLFSPFGILISRAFMPESLMLMMFIISIYFIINYYDKPTIYRLILAALAACLAILIKLVDIFPIISLFLALGLLKEGFKFFKNPRAISFYLTILILACPYYIYMIFFSSLKTHADIIWSPAMLLTTFFWIGWLEQIGKLVGIIPFIIAIFGFFNIRNYFCKVSLAGLFVGYFIYALIFTYTTATHDYYQITLFPVVCLALGQVFPSIKNYMTKFVWQKLRFKSFFCVAVLVGLASIFNLSLKFSQIQYRSVDPAVEKNLRFLGSIAGVHPNLIKFVNPDFDKTVSLSRQIGNLVNHSTKTIFLAFDYGTPLIYYGEIYGYPWPKIQDRRLAEVRRQTLGNDVKENFRKLTANFIPEYFIITDIKEFQAQQDLQDFLNNNFLLLVKNDDYIIYNLKKEGL